MISFVRIDDRMIHGQTVTRWALEYPCDGIIAVNDAAASNKVLKSAYKGAAPDKWILCDLGFVPSDVKTVIVGPCNDRPGAVKLGNNQSITPEEAQALEDISKKGYDVVFALLKDNSIGPWSKFRDQFDLK